MHDESNVGRWLLLLRDGTEAEQQLARTELGLILEARGLLDEAADAFERNVAEGTTDRRPYERLAAIARLRGDAVAEARALRGLAELLAPTPPPPPPAPPPPEAEIQQPEPDADLTPQSSGGDLTPPARRGDLTPPARRGDLTPPARRGDLTPPTPLSGAERGEAQEIVVELVADAAGDAALTGSAHLDEAAPADSAPEPEAAPDDTDDERESVSEAVDEGESTREDQDEGESETADVVEVEAVVVDEPDVDDASTLAASDELPDELEESAPTDAPSAPAQDTDDPPTVDELPSPDDLLTEPDPPAPSDEPALSSEPHELSDEPAPHDESAPVADQPASLPLQPVNQSGQQGMGESLADSSPSPAHRPGRSTGLGGKDLPELPGDSDKPAAANTDAPAPLPVPLPPTPTLTDTPYLAALISPLSAPERGAGGVRSPHPALFRLLATLIGLVVIVVVVGGALMIPVSRPLSVVPVKPAASPTADQQPPVTAPIALPSPSPSPPPSPTAPAAQSPVPSPTVAAAPLAARCTDAALRFPESRESEAAVRAAFREYMARQGVTIDPASTLFAGLAEAHAARHAEVMAGWMAVTLQRERRGLPTFPLVDYVASDIIVAAGPGEYQLRATISPQGWNELRALPPGSCEGAFLSSPGNARWVELMQASVGDITWALPTPQPRR